MLVEAAMSPCLGSPKPSMLPVPDTALVSDEPLLLAAVVWAQAVALSHNLVRHSPQAAQVFEVGRKPAGGQC